MKKFWLSKRGFFGQKMIEVWWSWSKGWYRCQYFRWRQNSTDLNFPHFFRQLSLKMFGRRQWTLFADQVRLSELFRGKIFVLILGFIFDTPLFTFFVRFWRHLKYWHWYHPLGWRQFFFKYDLDLILDHFYYKLTCSYQIRVRSWNTRVKIPYIVTRWSRVINFCIFMSVFQYLTRIWYLQVSL
jgi:hypothetical protein